MVLATGENPQPPPQRPPILVLGLGNILLRDEGIGVHVVRALADLAWPAEVELCDGGTAGLNLLDLLADRSSVIVIDALDSDDPVGSIRCLHENELGAECQPLLSLHDLGLMEALAAARRIGCAPQRIAVIGVRPRVVAWGLELSAEIAALVPRLVEMVKAEVAAALVAQATAA